MYGEAYLGVAHDAHRYLCFFGILVSGKSFLLIVLFGYGLFSLHLRGIGETFYDGHYLLWCHAHFSQDAGISFGSDFSEVLLAWSDEHSAHVQCAR